MSISLENLFSMQQSIQNTGTGASGQPVSGVAGNAVNNAANLLLQNMFSTGDVISGKVTSMQGNVVELLLPGGQNLSAVLGQNIAIKQGEQMMFAIKNMQGNQMELNPLFTNTANTTTVMKALDGAGLPVNEQNVAMVQNMMERGMSIQKEVLQAVKKSITQFPSAPVEDVVTLHSLKMPVNEANLTQLTAYKNSENQIMKPLMDMLGEVPSTFDALVEANDTKGAVNLYKDLIQVFGEMPENGKEASMTVKNDMMQPQGVGETIQELPNLPQNAPKMQEAIKDLLSKFGLKNDQIEAILKENPSNQQIVKVIHNQIVNNAELTEDVLAKIFKDDTFKELMKQTGKEVSTLSPKEVADHDNIDTLYEHLQKRADKILESLAGKEDFALAKSAQNLKANVDFMNQMNQMFQYVQLPLKFAESHANGELYVYGNGKKLSLEDGNVSALLHLDMEHLGTVDIHVEMNPEKQVKTNFYFEDEAMLDFIYEHIDMLNERLEKRGYGPVTNVQLKDDTTKTPVSEIFEKKDETPVLLMAQSFDARI